MLLFGNSFCVFARSYWGGPLSLVMLLSSVSDVVLTLPTVFSRDERHRCVAWNSVKLARRWYTVYTVSFRSFILQLGARRTYIFCLVSQAISSPYVTVNAYRDTAPCLKLQICAVEEEETICLLVMCSKLGSYLTPAGIYSHFSPSGQLLRCCVDDRSLAKFTACSFCSTGYLM